MTRHEAASLLATTLCLIALLVALGCVAAAPVVQGRVVSSDASAKIITVQDELRPTDAPLVFDLAGAEMGTPPMAGDEVRLAYRQGDGKNRVLRVMNLTQQKEHDKEK